MKNYLTLFIAATLLCGCYKRNLEPVVSGTSILSRVAGDGISKAWPVRFSGDGGPATNAMLHYPTEVVADKQGNIFINDLYNDRIRKIDKNGIITTFAGRGSITNYDGLPATDANMNIFGIAIDEQGNLYVTDRSRNRITKIDPQGIAHIIAGRKIQNSSVITKGFSGDGGPATDALMNGVETIAVDGNYNVYIDDFNNKRIRKINAQGIISTLIGGGRKDPTKGGMAIDAGPINTTVMAVDKDNNLYATYFDQNNIESILKITPDGKLSTVLIFNEKSGFTPDGYKAMGAKLDFIRGMAFDANGHLYFSEFFNHIVRMIDGLGVLHTVAGIANDTLHYAGLNGPAINATVAYPRGLCFDSYGNLYIASDKDDAVYKMSK
jgi:hypothetical protein